tara:strand:- start:952 stop:1569 length:618 start_codon:yes stop_codon:yes gene_type:complete
MLRARFYRRVESRKTLTRKPLYCGRWTGQESYLHWSKSLMGNSLIAVGAIAGSFGVNGEVRLKSFCTNPKDIEIYSPLTTDDKEVYKVKIVKSAKGALVAKLSNITNKEQAMALKGLKLYANRSQFPELLEEEYYHSDLINMKVFNTNGQDIGSVMTILNHGATDIIDIMTYDGKKLLVAFTKQFVPTIDLKKRVIVIDPPEEIS